MQVVFSRRCRLNRRRFYSVFEGNGFGVYAAANRFRTNGCEDFQSAGMLEQHRLGWQVDCVFNRQPDWLSVSWGHCPGQTGQLPMWCCPPSQRVLRRSYWLAPSARAAAAESASWFASALPVGQPARCCALKSASAAIHSGLSLRQGM